jgi:hypothetical protein
MVIPTRRIESIGSFWCLLILRSKELANYKYSKCHLIRCLLYVQIASKIKTDDCRMLLSPESHSKAKSSINGPTLMPLLVFSFWNYPQLKRYCNFYCRASSRETVDRWTIQGVANCFVTRKETPSTFEFIRWLYRDRGLQIIWGSDDAVSIENQVFHYQHHTYHRRKHWIRCSEQTRPAHIERQWDPALLSCHLDKR